MSDAACPVCGAPHATCTGAGGGHLIADLSAIPKRERNTMAELKEYRVNVNGNETTMQLSERDAERLGGVPVTSKSEPLSDRDAAERHIDARTKARSADVANTARKTQDKS